MEFPRFAIWPLSLLLILASFTPAAFAQETETPDGAEQTLEALRELRDRLFAAYENRDVDALLEDCTEDIVITWQNGERNEGHQEFRDFYARMMSGDSAIVKDISSKLEVEGKSILYGEDTAVARGSVEDKFSLSSGQDFTLNSRWTATVVQEGDQWKVASFHISASIFENPILGAAKNNLYLVGGIGALCGLALGFLIARSRRQQAAT